MDDRLEKLQQDVGVLANTTDDILKSLEGSLNVSPGGLQVFPLDGAKIVTRNSGEI